MSIVATHFILHHKMLNVLKAEERIPKETTVNDISFRQVAKLYGLEKLRKEVKKKLTATINSCVSFIKSPGQ
jgi:hypothetical protein